MNQRQDQQEADIATLEQESRQMRARMERLEKENAELTEQLVELREATEEIIAISDRKHDAWDKAKAAIARTKGRATPQTPA